MKEQNLFVTVRLKLRLDGSSTPDDIVDRADITLTSSVPDVDICDVYVYEVRYLPADIEKSPASCDLVLKAQGRAMDKSRIVKAVTASKAVVTYSGSMGRVLESKIVNVSPRDSLI